MEKLDVRTLTNTEKMALASLLSQEEAARTRFAAFRSAFEADLRNRLALGADGTLRIDPIAGTVEVVPDVPLAQRN